MKTYGYLFLVLILAPVFYHWGRRKCFEVKLSKFIKAYVLSTYGDSVKLHRLKVDQHFSKFIPFNKGDTLTYYREVVMSEGDKPIYFKIIRPGTSIRLKKDQFHILDTYQVFKWEECLTHLFDSEVAKLMPEAILITSLRDFKLDKNLRDLNHKPVDEVLRVAKPMTYFDIYAPVEGIPDMELYLQYAYQLKTLIQKQFLKQEFVLTIRFPKDVSNLSNLQWLKSKAMNIDAPGFYRKRVRYHHNRFTDHLNFNEFTSECLHIK